MATKLFKRIASRQVAMALVLLLAIALPAVEAKSFLAEEMSPPALGPGSVKTILVAGGILSEPIIEISRGDTVIWFIANRPAAMYFDEEGSLVPVICISTQGPHLTDTRAYTTGILFPGQKASLYFIEPGTYEYVVVFNAWSWYVEPQPQVLAGRIIVR